MSSLTLKDITQYIQHNTSIPLLGDTAQDFAENILAAQSPTVCSYCASEPLSLQYSINATIKAINLEDLFGYKSCDEDSCPIAWAQSNIAIDTNTAIGFDTTYNVSTTEPAVMLLLALAFTFAAVYKLIKPSH